MSKTAVLEEKSEQAAEKSANNVNDEKKDRKSVV